MAPARWILILLEKAKAKARASKVEARAFSKAIKAAGRVNRPEGERLEGVREEECMATRADLVARGASTAARKATYPQIAHCLRCAITVAVRTIWGTTAQARARARSRGREACTASSKVGRRTGPNNSNNKNGLNSKIFTSNNSGQLSPQFLKDFARSRSFVWSLTENC